MKIKIREWKEFAITSAVPLESIGTSFVGDKKIA